MSTRSAAVAGTFYPEDPETLMRAVDGFLSAATGPTGAKVIIAPHAGYVYSGALAGAAYHALASAPDLSVTRVVIIAPAHRQWVPASTAPVATNMATPLGVIALDPIVDDPQLGILRDDRPHAREHAVEVHLPFIQRRFPHARVVPLVASETSPAAMAALLDRLWGGAETRIVISSDLSHFHEYSDAQARDRRTCERVLALAKSPPLDGEDACGAVGINGMIALAGTRSFTPRLIGMCNSGDAAPSSGKKEVVGYGAIAFDVE